MDLYSDYVTNRESGKKKYETLRYVDPNLPYGAAMEQTGLKNMVSGEAVTTVCDTLYRYYEEEASSQGSGHKG